MNRDDIHRPSVIQPEEYDFIGIAYDPKAEHEVGGLMLLAEEQQTIRHFMKLKGARYASHSHGGSCYCCGAQALYLAVFYHEKTNECIKVGETCAEKLRMGEPERFATARRSVKAALDAIAGKRKAQALLNNLGLGEAWKLYESTEAAKTKEELTVRDMVRGLIRHGRLTEKQEAFLKRLLYTIANKDRIMAEREAEKLAALPCPTGRIVIIGTVLTVKTVESVWGDTLKMLVKTKEGYTVWGSVPSGLTVNRGEPVTFKATVEPSKDDPKHGFFSRPKALALEAVN